MNDSAATATQLVPSAAVSADWVDIEPSSGWSELRLREIWAYRELLYFLIWREIKVRYRQTAMGASWALIQPLSSMLIFSVVFGRLAKVPSDNIPYPLFALAGLVPWSFLANGFSQSSNILVGNSNLITKIYFPRLCLPLATVLSGGVDLAIAFGLLAAFMGYEHMAPSPHIIWLPAFLLLAFACTVGAGLWLSALNVEYRDVKYIVPFMTQIWMYATPIAYPSSLLKGPLRTLCGLNPMAGVVEGIRWCLFGSGDLPGAMLAVSSVVALLMALSGAYYFRRMERNFADLI